MKLKQTAAAPILLLAVFALTAIFKMLPAEYSGIDTDPYLAAVIIQLVIFAIPSLLFCTLRGNDYSGTLRIRFPRPSCIILMICAIVLMSAGGSVIDYFMSTLAPELMAEEGGAAYVGAIENMGPFDGLYMLLAFAVLPAVTEEFLFRGIVLTEYSNVSVSCSVIMSSLMFAMCHFSLVRFPSYFFCGIVLGALTYATRSVIAAIVVHALYNVSVMVFGEYIIHLADKSNITGILFVIIAAIIALGAASLAAFEASSIYKGYADNNVDSEYVPKKKRSLPSALLGSMFSPFFLLLVVMFIVMTLIP